MVINPKAIQAFADEAAFAAWLALNHDQAAEAWIKIYKRASGRPSINWNQAVDVALCWGWIDGVRKPLDAEAFLQRFTPRKPKSRWSQVNTQRVERLIASQRMTEHGRKHIDAAKADGRWAAAYQSPKNSEPPADFLLALSRAPAAKRTYDALKKQHTFAIAYRLHHLKSAPRRAEVIADVVARLSVGELPFAKSPRPTGSPQG